MSQSAKPVIAIHGGSGTIPRGSLTPQIEAGYRRALGEAIMAGQTILAANGSALDAVVAAVRVMEDSPYFNAGKGSVLTSEGRIEMDSSIMDGNGARAGAVAGVRRVRNPILAAQAVMETSRHVLFTGEGADAFAASAGLEMMPEAYFIIPRRTRQLEDAKKRRTIELDHIPIAPTQPEKRGALELDPDSKFGTVGAVALDSAGNLAAATSTGGMTNKMPGRVGDSPIIGAGTYAENGVVAVSGTGLGEMFIRSVGAYDIAARMKYAGMTTRGAMDAALARIEAIQGQGGFIAVDAKGEPIFGFTTEGMYRASARIGETPAIKIYQDE